MGSTSSELRQAFLDYFASNGHEIVASSSLVPANDPTLLFTNAGMVQFKDVFLGREKRAIPRAASSQRCVRAGGKHNDLENVGYTARHHTFFEMLGNFSFGDYFKREAIHYAWELVTRRAATAARAALVHGVRGRRRGCGDLARRDRRRPRSGSRGSARRTTSGPWATRGPAAPAARSSTTTAPRSRAARRAPPTATAIATSRSGTSCSCSSIATRRGELTPLPKPSVDTGMGLERLAAVMQGVHSNYEIDLFVHLIEAAAAVTRAADLADKSLRVIADHIRACSFLIADGVVPGNEGRGYVLRRIIRRAIRHGYKLGVEEPFFYKLVKPLETRDGRGVSGARSASAATSSACCARKSSASPRRWRKACACWTRRSASCPRAASFRARPCSSSTTPMDFPTT